MGDAALRRLLRGRQVSEAHGDPGPIDEIVGHMAAGIADGVEEAEGETQQDCGEK